MDESNNTLQENKKGALQAPFLIYDQTLKQPIRLIIAKQLLSHGAANKPAPLPKPKR
ncbi:hypothetical protein SAMN04515695_2883 [Pseudovibrio sp. Tun.PSC04-5.I4]|nr:hypothetical protein SAMN04515695_2883 [Pseudovibrio sp. Tun.PSC04-5.I4]